MKHLYDCTTGGAVCLAGGILPAGASLPVRHGATGQEGDLDPATKYAASTYIHTFMYTYMHIGHYFILGVIKIWLVMLIKTFSLCFLEKVC